MKQDIEFKIKALVAILRQNKVKVWVDFRKHNKSSLQGVYGELCDKIRKLYGKVNFKIDSTQMRWLVTMKVLPSYASWETTTTLKEDMQAGRKYCENS